MADPKAQATELKNQGNKAFQSHDWPKAIEFYTKAIKLNPEEPTLYSNRAQVRIFTVAFITLPGDILAKLDLISQRDLN